MKHLPLLALITSTLFLSGCVSRDQADTMIAKGCLAVAEAFLTDGFRIKEVKNKKFDIASGLGHGYRQVTISAIEEDGWAEIDKDYECVFAENFGFMKTTYSAGIYSFTKDDLTIGSVGGQITGGLEKITKMNKAAENAMK